MFKARSAAKRRAKTPATSAIPPHHLQGGDSRGRELRRWHSQLGKSSLGTGDGVLVKLLKTMRGKDDTDDHAQEGKGNGGEFGLVHVIGTVRIGVGGLSLRRSLFTLRCAGSSEIYSYQAAMSVGQPR